MTQQSEAIYRANLEGVCEFIKIKYGDNRRTLNVHDVAEYMAQCRNTVRKKYFKRGSSIVTIENFARIISKI